MNDLTKALKEDLTRISEMRDECGLRVCGNPYQNDADKHDRFFWAVGVALYHLLECELKRRKEE